MSTETRKKTILFVDDDPVSIKLIINEFKKVFGSSVQYEKANDAKEAEEIIMEYLSYKGTLPSLIVSDWMMPGKRGDHFLKDVADVYPEIALVLHSGMASNETVNMLEKDAELLCFLPKPWDGKLNIDKIFRALSH
jgi:DNA-binding NtrC family response regulator